jgi:hypothetical protein
MVDTSTPGRHTFTVTATSQDGQTATKSITYTVAGAPSVSIQTPASGASYKFGQKLSAAFSCAEGASGPGIKSCLDQNGQPSGSAVDTSTPGQHTFTVIGTSADGQATARTVTFTVRPNNVLLAARRKPHSNGTFIVTVRVPGPGAVDILLTAWMDNVATIARVLNPAQARFVFARAHATAKRAGTLQIPVYPDAQGRRLVAHHRYRVTLRLWISYTPTHGQQRDIGYYGLHLP